LFRKLGVNSRTQAIQKSLILNMATKAQK